MYILTQLSGHGRTGISNTVKREEFEEAIGDIDNFPNLPEEWVSPEFIGETLRGTFGLDRSLHFLDSRDETKVIFGWSPNYLGAAMRSVGFLSRFLEKADFEELNRKMKEDERIFARSRNLITAVSKQENGWGVQANFGDPIWDIIESDEFADDLPKINARLREYHEERRNSPVPGQYATVFKGKDGLNLQIYQPVGNGLWIVGSRNREMGYQLCDHNTDTDWEAFLHVLSLCIVLDQCRSRLT